MRELRSGFFFFGLSLLVIWESLRVGLGTLKVPGPGLLSFCAAVLLCLFSLVLTYRGWHVRELMKFPSHRVILALICVSTYSLVLDTLGFVAATFLLIGILFRLGKTRPWWTVMWMSALVTFLAYLVFGILLRVHFPRGFLGI